MINRLALVTETFPPDVNGVAMTLNRLSRHLSDRGVELQVVRPKARNSYDWGLKGSWETVSVTGLPIPGYPEAQIGIPSLGQLKKIWSDKRPDIVHVATEGVLGWMAVRAALSLDIPLITSFHTNFHDYTEHYHVSWLKPLVIRYLRSIHGKARVNLVPDPDLIEELHRLGFENGEYFGRGVDTELFHPGRRSQALRQSWGVVDDTPVFLHVSRVAAEKNMPLVLDAYEDFKQKINPAARFVVVGDGPARAALEKRYSGTGSGVIFTGMKFDHELAQHYASADLSCFASETETFGNVILESMASGCPVVTYHYAAGKQYVSSGEEGLTVPLGDEPAFRQQMHELGSDLKRCREMGLKARKQAEQIPWSGVIEGYLRVVSRVLRTP